MVLLFLLVLLIPLPLAAFDVLRHHLETHVNYSVNPCDDFYAHVCKSEPSEDFIWQKLKHSFRNISEKFRLNLTNDILLDIKKMDSGNSESMKNMNYKEIARKRCGENLECYRIDQEYFKEKLRVFNPRFIDQAENEYSRIFEPK
ncbi:hypothetical protein PMAYCL1PPCAC_31338 [Pristionchus mayeri]|uniref:Peptidase n=1 Tax=Pristionchus mayeri TaxID=1317129 RepID=A0AAN5DCU5_9BILA|nr:hypothetical protein PMAYCL1PPCAC_31338 [Pristionchus mayeri]